jgi:hypothetical protein
MLSHLVYYYGFDIYIANIGSLIYKLYNIEIYVFNIVLLIHNPFIRREKYHFLVNTRENK